MILSQVAFARGACGGLAGILVPLAVDTASDAPVNWPARSLIRNLTGVARWPRSIRKLRAACVVHAPPGWAAMPTLARAPDGGGTALRDGQLRVGDGPQGKPSKQVMPRRGGP